LGFMMRMKLSFIILAVRDFLSSEAPRGRFAHCVCIARKLDPVYYHV
jgi:hypothetical protein